MLDMKIIGLANKMEIQQQISAGKLYVKTKLKHISNGEFV